MKNTGLPASYDETVDPEKIIILRNLFLEEYEKNSDLYDERDLNHLKEFDLHAIRYLIANQQNVDAALESLKKSFQWRKSFKLHDLTEESFPKEFFDLGGLFECGKDNFGFPCLYVRTKTIRKIKFLDIHQMQFLAYHVNKLERKTEKLQSWTLVFDCTNIGFCNVNLDLIRFLIDLLRDYFPLSVRYAIVLDVPWILNAIQKFVLSLLAEENKQLIRFVNRKSIKNFITDDNLPLILGGNSTIDIFTHSSKCKPIKILAKELYNLEPEETEKLMKPYINLLKDTQKFKDNEKEKNQVLAKRKFNTMKVDDRIEVLN